MNSCEPLLMRYFMFLVIPSEFLTRHVCAMEMFWVLKYS